MTCVEGEMDEARRSISRPSCGSIFRSVNTTSKVREESSPTASSTEPASATP